MADGFVVPSMVCIVEGHGEDAAIRSLVRRVVTDIDPSKYVDVSHIIRVSRYKIVGPGELERDIELAARRLARPGAIFVLLDSEDACPAVLGPELLKRARQQRNDIPISVVLAKHEYEAWFLAAAESLRTHRKIDPAFPPRTTPPESPRDAKGQVETMMRNRIYSPTSDQASLTEHFDLAMARSAHSFDKCYRDLTGLVSQLFAVEK